MELWQLMNTYGQQNPQNTTTPSSYSQANPQTQQYAYPNYPQYPASTYPNQPAYNYDYYASQQMQYPTATPAYPYYDPSQYAAQSYYQMPPQYPQANRNRFPPNRRPNPKPKSDPKPVQTFRCEDCDKSYNNEEFYQRHMAGHVRCEIEGCNFIGSQSALQVHQLRAHNPRYRDAFKLLESPEGLNKYLEERKKNFPTKDNVTKKQEELQKKISRGEVVLQTKRFRDKKGRWHTEKQYCVNKNYKPKITENEPTTTTTNIVESPLEEGELPEESSSKIDPKQELVVIEEQEKEIKERKKRLCKHFKKGHCDRGNSCMFLHDESLINVKRKREDQSQHVSKKPTLLEKLLSKDILEEKSVVLQCLRFIVQNGFFEKPAAASV